MVVSVYHFTIFGEIKMMTSLLTKFQVSPLDLGAHVMVGWFWIIFAGLYIGNGTK